MSNASRSFFKHSQASRYFAQYTAGQFYKMAKVFRRAGVLEALRKAGRLGTGPAQPKPTTAPKPFAGGELQLLRNRVVVCGVEVPITPLMQRILTVLNERHANGKFVARSGEELAEHDAIRCSRGQNGISDAIHQLRKRITSKVFQDANILVGDLDIILSKGLGYRICDTITTVVGTRRPSPVLAIGLGEESADPDENSDVPDHVPVDSQDVPDRDPDVPDEKKSVPVRSERQRWIMPLMEMGTEVRIGMVVEHFCCSEKTAKRDLTELKERSLIRFVGSPRTGHYVLT